MQVRKASLEEEDPKSQSAAPSPAHPADAGKRCVRHKRKRRAATSMEYLVMLSFIFLAVIIAVQTIGSAAGSLLRNSADATAKTNGQ